jgi:hypothetical protein
MLVSAPRSSRFLDHNSLAVTTTYLCRLKGQEDRGWGKVAEAIGLWTHSVTLASSFRCDSGRWCEDAFKESLLSHPSRVVAPDTARTAGAAFG